MNYGSFSSQMASATPHRGPRAAAWDYGSRDDYCESQREHPEDYPKQKPDDAA